jgi:hypothetical protein
MATTTTTTATTATTATPWSREEYLALQFAVSAIAHRSEERRSAENIHAFLITLDHNSLSYLYIWNIWNRSVEEIAAVLADARVTEEDDAEMADFKLAERALQKSKRFFIDSHMRFFHSYLLKYNLTVFFFNNKHVTDTI